MSTFDVDIKLVEDSRDDDRLAETVDEEDRELNGFEVDGFKLVVVDGLAMVDELETNDEGNVQLVRIMPRKAIVMVKNLLVNFLSMIQC